MSQIKTIEQVHREDESLQFGIARMEDHYHKREKNPNPPHRHDFYTVIVTSKAKGQHIIDFNEYTLAGNQIYFVNPGQVHQVIEKEKSFGYSMVFSTQFLINNNIELSFIENLNLFNDYGASPPLQINESQLHKISFYCNAILEAHTSDIEFKNQTIEANLKLFLIACNTICTGKINSCPTVKSSNKLLKDFKSKVEKNFTEWHATTKYADALFITPDHLNRTIKSLIGKTAKEYIQTRISIEAKRLLFFSELSIKEIGFQLGFKEASNFSTFFKKITGNSPANFKKTR